MLKIANFFGLIFIGQLLIGQSEFKNFEAQISLQSDFQPSLKISGINYNKPFLATFSLINKGNGVLIYQADSIYIKKGLNYFNFNVPDLKLDTNVTPILECFNHSSRATHNIMPQIKVKRERLNVSINDTALFVSNNKLIKPILQIETKELSNQILIQSPNDTIPLSALFPKQAFFEDTVELKVQSKGKTHWKSSYYYNYGRLEPLKTDPQRKTDNDNLEEHPVKLSGNLYVQNQFYQETPFHSSTAMYPNTYLQLSNDLNVFGLPFNITLSHNTSQAISPNFRNFVSFRFDAHRFREQVIQELIQKNKTQEYDLSNLQPKMNMQRKSLDKLERIEHLMESYPDAPVNIDSLMQNEIADLEADEQIDSCLMAQNPDYEMPSNDSTLQAIDSSNQKKKIAQLKKRLERSMYIKEQYAQKQSALPNDWSRDYKPSDLYRNYTTDKYPRNLLLIEQFELGNFYHYAGEYSIRDVEMIGVNTSVQIHPKYSINILQGKINDFPYAFASHLETRNERALSVALTQKVLEQTFSYRYTRFTESISNPEFNAPKSYNLLSFNAEGNISASVQYGLELNNSSLANATFQLNENQNGLEQSALRGQINVQPIDQLNVEVDYRRVGSQYRSEGVYFLQRNLQAYNFSSTVFLFDKQLKLKGSLAITDRNIEQSEIDNRLQKYYYEVLTRFRRYPNLQIIYSPVSVQLATQLDTSFTRINANSNILISRLFFLKKIKRTILNFSLNHVIVDNDLDQLQVQSQTQFLAHVKTRKNEYSSSLSFQDKLRYLRFISGSARIKLNEKLGSIHQVAYQFQNLSPYPWNIRNGLAFKARRNLILSASNFLLLKVGKSNLGGELSLRLTY